MHPVLIDLGPFALHTYGVLVAAGMLLALRYALVRLRARGMAEALVLDMALYAVIAGFLGARLTYVALNARYYLAHPAEVLAVWSGGLVYYGGFIAGAAAVVLFARRQAAVPLWTVADVFGPALALAHTLGRVGCFFAGCCYGRESSGPLAVTFCDPASLAPVNVPRHPTQLYEAAGTLVLFLLLDRSLRRAQAPGRTFGWYLCGYAALRFGIEFLRGDDRGGAFLGLSPAQAVSLVLAVVGCALLLTRRAPAGGRP